MSEKERVNKILDSIKALIGGFLIALTGMVSYLFVNFEKLPSVKIVVILIGCSILSVGVLFLTKVFIKHLNKLGDL